VKHVNKSINNIAPAPAPVVVFVACGSIIVCFVFKINEN